MTDNEPTINVEFHYIGGSSVRVILLEHKKSHIERSFMEGKPFTYEISGRRRASGKPFAETVLVNSLALSRIIFTVED